MGFIDPPIVVLIQFKLDLRLIVPFKPISVPVQQHGKSTDILKRLCIYNMTGLLLLFYEICYSNKVKQT